ncbi:MAG: preprotein translocase subunit SecY [Acutalibacteraceae bacterium]|jgi:preprotein translocase subunit SecY
MFKTIANAWRIEDLRKKLLYTAMIIFIFRIGAAIPVPFVNAAEGIISNTDTSSFISYLVMMTGDAFNYGTIFAMSITPYINASIILQLLQVVIPALERLAQEGEEGRKKINAITRYTAIGLGVLQSTAYYVYLRSGDFLSTDAAGKKFTGFSAVLQALVIIGILTAGAALVMWLGEQINEKGIGNGISLILFAGIISRIPALVTTLFQYFNRGGVFYGLVPLAGIIMILMIAFIVWMDNAEHRIPVQYAKRVVGRKMYGGQSSHIPLKVNMSGVLPVIFASSILSIPPTIQLFVNAKSKFWTTILGWFNQTSPLYVVIYFFMIIFFAYFYSQIQYNPVEMANNLRKNSGAIPGIRPGEPTVAYITKIMSKITLLGALLLSVVALFPIIFSQSTTLLFGETRTMNISLGGTSIIILVGVALETVQQLESQMMMRHYKGFLD